MGEAMIRLYLVRHGHAASRFAAARDPGLDVDGFTQADVVAARLAPEGPLPIVVSSLLGVSCPVPPAPAASRSMRRLSHCVGRGT